MATILITGGTGLIGTALSKVLADRGHDVIILTRKAKPANGNIQYKEWNVEKGTIDVSAITEADCIVHLAGANVADGRWTKKRKQEIIGSRVKSGELLVKALQEHTNKVRAVVSASAQGWYGPDPQVPNPAPFTETDPPYTDFLGTTCKAWEDAIAPVAQLGKRLVTFRIGIVLSKEGGAYAEFKKPVSLGAATILGNGRQVVSWVHIRDLTRLFTAAVENDSWKGVYNAVAPNPVSNKAIILQIAKERDKFYVPFNVPSFALKIALGEMSIEVLKSVTVSSAKVLDEGFEFLYPTIGKAVAALEFKI